MIFDDNARLSKAQVVTAVAPSDNVYDTGANGTPPYATAPLNSDLGKSELSLLVALAADAAGTSPTLQVELQVSPDNATWRTVVSHTFTGGKAGDRWPFRYLPEGVDDRYVRLLYTPGGTGPQYTVDAGFVAAVQTND